MSRFSRDRGERQKPQPRQDSLAEKVEVSFFCQTCDEEVDEADFMPTLGQYKWHCSKGHESVIGGMY